MIDDLSVRTPIKSNPTPSPGADIASPSLKALAPPTRELDGGQVAYGQRHSQVSSKQTAVYRVITYEVIVLDGLLFCAC